MPFVPDAPQKERLRFVPDAAPAAPGIIQRASAGVAAPQVDTGKTSLPAFLMRVMRSHEDLVPTNLPAAGDAVKRLFTPSPGNFGPSKAMEEAGGRVGVAVRGSAKKIGEDIATSPHAPLRHPDIKNPVLSALLNGTSPAAAPYIKAVPGALLGTATDVLGDSLKPSAVAQQIGAEGMGIAGKTAEVQAIKDAVIAPVEGLAQSAGRRALGFVKGQLNKLRRVGGVERANDVAKFALDKGIISPLGGTDEMLNRAGKIGDAAGVQIGKVISSIEEKGIQSPVVGEELSGRVGEALTKDAGKGPTTAQTGAIQEIVDRIKAHADPKTGAIGYQDLQDLKQLLQERGKFLSTSDAEKAAFYRKASGMVNSDLRQAIGHAGKQIGGEEGKNLLDTYLQSNLEKGKVNDAVRSLEDRQRADAGRKLITPFEYVAEALATMHSMAQGNPTAVATTTGIIAAKKFLEKFGAELTATGARNLVNLVKAGEVPALLTNPAMSRVYLSQLNRKEKD